MLYMHMLSLKPNANAMHIIFMMMSLRLLGSKYDAMTTLRLMRTS